MKTWRFFYHFHRAARGMTVHFRGRCLQAQNVYCHVPCETKWRTNQPLLVMQGHASDVRIVKGTAHIV